MKGVPLKSKAAKVEWLLAHPDIWQGYPNQTRNHRTVFAFMQAAGLYTDGVRWQEVDITPLISAARKERRDRRFQFRLPAGKCLNRKEHKERR